MLAGGLQETPDEGGMTDIVIEEPATGGVEPSTARVQHVSTWQELVPLHLKFLALTLLTLGVYQFWARTKARRFLWQKTRLLGDPFVYLGRPLELLLGFVVAVVLILGPIVALNILVLAPVGQDPAASASVAALALSAVQAVAIPYLVFVGAYAARRYRLSRTAWRGIRGAQTGSAWRYGLVGFLSLLATSLTFAWYYPWQRAKLARLRIDNSWLGSQRFDCDIKGGHLVSAFAVLWFGALTAIIVLPLLGVGAAFLVLGGEGLDSEPDTGSLQLLLSFVPLLVIYAPIGFFLLIYRALELREVARHTSFAGGAVRLAMTHSVWQYVGYALGN
jgi:uncharacterized membrane protein YjgN (DUF898 family)